MNREVKNASYLEANGKVERLAYNAALNLYRNAPSNTPMLPSTLRSETILGIQQQINWKLIDGKPNPGNAGVVRSSEKRLGLQDGFFIYGMSVMFGNELTAGVVPGAVLLQTWENPAAVAVLPATVGGFGLNAPSLIEAYNGTLDILIDTVQYGNGIDMLHFKRVDTAQAGLLWFTASTLAQSYFRSDEVFFEVQPFINIIGRTDATFTCNLPDQTAFNLVALNRVIAVLLLRGLKIANGAEMM